MVKSKNSSSSKNSAAQQVDVSIEQSLNQKDLKDNKISGESTANAHEGNECSICFEIPEKKGVLVCVSSIYTCINRNMFYYCAIMNDFIE